MAYLESFRLLHEDLQQSTFQSIGGYHDLETAFLNSQHAGNTLVSRHEMLHDQVLTQTNYGCAQNIFRFAMRSQVSNVRGSATRWCSTLIEASRCTHETYATYLSIKQFAASREAEILATHPTQYQEYFHNLAKIVDPIFTSSFGQYLIGKTIIEICFSSCILDSLLSWTPDDNAQIIPEHKPDFRLNSSISLWKDELPNLLSILLFEVDKCRTTIGLSSGFNLQCEDDWLNLHSNISEKLDDFLLDLIRKWMYPRAEELWPCSHPKEWMASRKKFTARISEFSQQNIEFGNMNLNGINPDLAGKAWRAGRFLIQNPTGGHVVFHEVAKDADPISILQFSPGEKILISDTPSQGTPKKHTWHLFSKSKEGTFKAVRLSHEACLKIFKVRTDIGAMGLPIPDIQLILVGLWAEPGRIDDTLHNEVIDCHRTKKLLIGIDRIVWYMGGDFICFYKTLLNQGRLRCQWTVDMDDWHAIVGQGTPPVEDIPQQDVLSKASEMREKGFTMSEYANIDLPFGSSPTWIMFELPEKHSTFLRILSRGAYQFVMTVLGQDIIDGKLEVMSRSEAGPKFERIQKANVPIALTWNKF